MGRKIYHIISIFLLGASLFFFLTLLRDDFEQVWKALYMLFKHDSAKLFLRTFTFAIIFIIIAISNSLAIFVAKLFYSDSEYNKRIDKLKESKKRLQREINQLQEDIEGYKTEISEKDTKINQLQHKIKNLKEEINAELEEDRNMLEQEKWLLEEEREKLNKIKEKLDKKESDISSKETKINKYLLKIKHLENKLSELQNKRDLRKQELIGLYDLFQRHLKKNAVLSKESAYQAYKYLRRAKRKRLF
jgi:peptidoglycan hydrolase CwlO-like protein